MKRDDDCSYVCGMDRKRTACKVQQPLAALCCFKQNETSRKNVFVNSVLFSNELEFTAKNTESIKFQVQFDFISYSIRFDQNVLFWSRFYSRLNIFGYDIYLNIISDLS